LIYREKKWGEKLTKKMKNEIIRGNVKETILK
jgi:hypothetical protein